MKSYKDLDVYNLAFEYAIEVHKMTGTLPSVEKYEQGSQIRRSAMSIKDILLKVMEGVVINRILLSFWFMLMPHY